MRREKLYNFGFYLNSRSRIDGIINILKSITFWKPDEKLINCCGVTAR